jgi:glycosyltransferase involved in cell wall biosynthesis
MVCVDYNYYNWIRTLDEIPDTMHLAVIPNYASNGISQVEFEKKLNSITDLRKSKIVLARRLTRYRGAQLFADVVKRLLENYPELDITIAGDGDLEENLKAGFADNKNVHMTKYSAEQSIDFHKQFDIAVVPTIYSEGTSLSLCEAMAAGCMPIATHVGGLTNLIIDSFNGKLCYPSEDAVYNALEELINKDIDEYKVLLRNSYNTYTSALNKDKWEERWIQFINSLAL